MELVPVIPYTEQTAYEHARLWAELESAGKRIGDYDLIRGGDGTGAWQRRGDIQHQTLWTDPRVKGHRT